MDGVDREKAAAARAAIAHVEAGMVVGLGSGSTAALAVRALGERVREGLAIVGVPTSRATARIARAEGIALVTGAMPLHVDLTIDGADELDGRLRLIKGGGGELLHEKIVASVSRRLIVVADKRKQVERLGSTFALPVEVIPFAWTTVARRVRDLGGKPRLRLDKATGEAFETTEGNRILDCDFGPILEPEALAAQLSATPGVVEHGLFIGLATEAIIAHGDKIEVLKP